MPLLTITALLAAGLVLQSLAWLRSSRRSQHATPRSEARDRRRAPSRATFDRLAERELERAVTLRRDVGLAIIDIDDLRAVNEATGFAAGDLVVAQVEETLIESLRRIDTMLTLGGGSWAVLIPDMPSDAFTGHVERVRATLQGHVTRANPATPAVTISAGLSIAADGHGAARDLLLSADQAVLAAKLSGGARLMAFDDATRQVLRHAGAQRRVQRDGQLATVLSLAEALDLRDADTSGHSNMVGYYAELMAQGLGLTPTHVERVRVAGLLHDIGKIGVPDSVLRKPGKLDADEWAQMQRHPEIGARLLASLDVADIRSWVLAHHERLDGAGYPNKLAADEIPMEARILSIADAYEAMTADRVYRKAPGPVIARQELDRCRGTQFDSEIVDVFLRALDGLERLDAPTEARFAA